MYKLHRLAWNRAILRITGYFENIVFPVMALLLTMLSAGKGIAETRIYSYNARGELTESTVSSGPASGVHTTIAYDPAGNRLSYQVSGSSAPIRFPIPITVPIHGLSIITIPE